MYRTDGQQPVAQPSDDQEDAAGGINRGAGPKTENPTVPVGARGDGTDTGAGVRKTASVHDILNYLDEWRKVLRTSTVRKALLQDLDPNDVIYQIPYFPRMDEQQIAAKQRNCGRTAAVDLFLDVLGRLGRPEWPTDLLQVLRRTNQGHLSDMLEKEYRRAKSNHNRVQESINSVPTFQTRTIPPDQLDALLQYGDVWKTTIRYERKLLRENVDPNEVSMYFPYLSTRVADKVTAVHAAQGRTRAMDAFIDDGLMYIGDHNWPNDLCYALRKVNQSFVAEKLKGRFLHLMREHEGTKYQKLARYIRNEPDWSAKFGTVLSSDRRK